jgi:HlyD family secretion protein
MKAPTHARRILTIAVAILLVAAIAGYAMRPEVITVETAAAERGPMRVTIDEDGRTRVHDRFVVAAPVAGRLERLTLHEGDRVEQGQVVARIAPLPLDSASRMIASARVRSAEAALREADAGADQARIAMTEAGNVARRRDALLAAGAISVEQRDQAAAESRSRAEQLDAATSRVRAARADVDAARAALMPSAGRGAHAVSVRSPAAGRVLRVLEPSERVIAASTPMIEIGNASVLEVVADVLSSDAVRIRPGNTVEIVEWGGDHPLVARVRSIEPSAFTRVSALGVDEQRVNVVVDLVDPPASLGDGFRVEIRATVWESNDVLTIPSSAVFQRGGSWNVFVVDGGRTSLRKVELGHRTGAAAEILKGLTAGEVVVLFPSDQVEDGSRVRQSRAIGSVK